MIDRRTFLAGASAALLSAKAPDKTVVLTFDDAVKSHRTFVAPLLKELGFRATFFVSHFWMNDTEHFMSWEEIAAVHRLGFEIGNHTWTHAAFSVPRNAARLAGEIALVENELNKVGVPRPRSFAYPGNFFGPEAFAVVKASGFKFARRGMQPEIPYGKAEDGPAYDPGRHHPLLIPTTGDAYPNWSLEHFRSVVSKAAGGRIAVLQFHGVPDIAHPWVHTPPEMFRRYMDYLRQEGFRVLAMQDLEQYADLNHPPADPLEKERYRQPKDGRLVLPVETEATRADLDYWLSNMLGAHHYTVEEAAQVCGLPPKQIPARRATSGVQPRVLPYPGGRHPRIGFLEGAINPLRGSKASVFLPWNPASYVVVDLPEAVFSNLGLTFLAHTHIPTIWNEQNIIIDNIDWDRGAGGALHSRWVLPNQISFGAAIRSKDDEIEMELWLRNGTPQPLTKLRTQICVMFKGAAGFEPQTNDNKLFRQPVAAAHNAKRDRWILTSWERCGRVWGNPRCPCMHSDPVLPDCAPGDTVRVRGRLWFHEGPA